MTEKGVVLTFFSETRFFIDFRLHLAWILRDPTLVPIERARSDCMLAVSEKNCILAPFGIDFGRYFGGLGDAGTSFWSTLDAIFGSYRVLRIC